MEFNNITVYLNDQKLGWYEEVIVKGNEARLYNGDLKKVIQFECMEETDSGGALTFFKFDINNHYFHNGIMAWDIIDQIMDYYGNDVDGSLGFYLGNIFKYLLRFKYKDQAQSDLEKVKVYIDRIMETL